MTQDLKRDFFAILSPAIIGFLIAAAVRYSHSLQTGLPIGVQHQLAPAIFVLSALFAVAGPIFCRTVFAYRQRQRKAISIEGLHKFERLVIAIALVAPYLALVAYVLQLPRFHLAGTLLMALYAVYYTYPTRKRIDFDMKIFRAGDVR